MVTKLPLAMALVIARQTVLWPSARSAYSQQNTHFLPLSAASHVRLAFDFPVATRDDRCASFFYRGTVVCLWCETKTIVSRCCAIAHFLCFVLCVFQVLIFCRRFSRTRQSARGLHECGLEACP